VRVEAAVPALLTEVDAHRVEPGHWTAQVPRDWWSWAGPHGGVLAALNLHAAGDAGPAGMTPRALSARFHRAAGPEPLVVRSAAERPGASTAIVTTETRQAGTTVLSTVTTLTAPRSGPLRQHVRPPTPPAPDTCYTFQLPVDFVPFGAHLEIRPAGGALPLTGSDLAEMRAWLRLRASRAIASGGTEPHDRPGPDDRPPPDGGTLPVDAAVAVVLVDALPPGIFPLLTAPVAVPTVELSVHFHVDLEAAPVDDWVFAVQRNASCSDGWCVDETELWSRDGRLLVQGRQLRRVLDGSGLS
jgi:acyl-CoA thioesterase